MFPTKMRETSKHGRVNGVEIKINGFIIEILTCEKG